MERLLNKSYIDVEYNHETGILHCTWKGQQTSEAILQAGDIILSIVREKKIVKVLNDNTLVIGTWHDITQWTSDTWFPLMEEAGMQFFAWIISDDVFAALSAMRATPHNSKSVEFFDQYEDAFRWLQSKP